MSAGRYLPADNKFLEPGEEPRAEFSWAESGAVYEHCNLHGLWRADF